MNQKLLNWLRWIPLIGMILDLGNRKDTSKTDFFYPNYHVGTSYILMYLIERLIEGRF